MKKNISISVLYFHVLAFSLMTITPAQANVIKDTLDPIIELLKIQDRYGDTMDRVTVRKHYIYEYHTGDLVSVDSSVSVIFTRSALQRFFMDSIETYQDNQYRVLVNHRDSVMYVTFPTPLYQEMFQMNLLDTIMQIRQIHDLVLYDSLNMHIIQYTYINESPFIYFRTGIDTATHRIYFVDFSIKTVLPEAGSSYIPIESFTDYTRMVTVFFEDLEPLDSLNYSTSKFIKIENGKLVPATAYQGYELIDYTRQE